MEKALSRLRKDQSVQIEPRIPFDLGDWSIAGLAEVM